MTTFDGLTNFFQGAGTASAANLALALLIAFITGQLNGWCYMWTHRGVSYSRNFTHAIVLISVISAVSMHLVSVNVIAAFGLLGGMAIIRFRTVVRDARDTAYVLLSLICGSAAGFGYYAPAIFGSVIVNLISLYMSHSGYGSWYTFDSLLRFQVDAAALGGDSLATVMKRFCLKHTVISVDDAPLAGPQGEPLCQCAYQVRLRDPEQSVEFVNALQNTLKVRGVHLLVQQDLEEPA